MNNAVKQWRKVFGGASSDYIVYPGLKPNGYAWWARTPLRQWCNRIPILAIPILVIHPDQDPNFSDPILAIPILAIPILAILILVMTTDIFKKKECQKCQTPTFCKVSLI
jgi:hypothetical protein